LGKCIHSCIKFINCLYLFKALNLLIIKIQDSDASDESSETSSSSSSDTDYESDNCYKANTSKNLNKYGTSSLGDWEKHTKV